MGRLRPTEEGLAYGARHLGDRRRAFGADVETGLKGLRLERAKKLLRLSYGQVQCQWRLGQIDDEAWEYYRAAWNEKWGDEANVNKKNSCSSGTLTADGRIPKNRP